MFEISCTLILSFREEIEDFKVFDSKQAILSPSSNSNKFSTTQVVSRSMALGMKVFVLLLVLGQTLAWNLARFGKQLSQVGRTAAAVAVIGTMGSPALADAIPLVGAAAPDFSLPSNAGKNIGLQDFKGKWTVLYTYPGDFTQGCTIEAQAFERDFPKYKALGAGIVGLSVDSVEKHLDFAKQYGLEFPLVSDVGGKVSSKYGSLIDLGFVGKFSNRQTYIIGPDQTVKAVFTDVESKVARHSTDVLAKLETLIGQK